MPEIITYAGGKYYAIPYLSPFVPAGTQEMVAPTIGGMHFELHCEAKGIRVFGSDIYKTLINFWEQVIKNPNRVADLVEWHVTAPSSSGKQRLPTYCRSKAYSSLQPPGLERNLCEVCKSGRAPGRAR